MIRTLVLALIASAAFACTSDYLIWIPRSISADPLYRFIKNGRAGYIDREGHVVIQPVLEAFGNYGGEFHDGRMEIGASDGRYIDRTGRVVINRGFYRGWDFSEGLAVAMKKGDNLWGYIKPSGDFAIGPRFATSPNNYVYSFSGGVARIQVNGKFGYIDRTGEFIIQPEFLDASEFSDGMARVVVEGPCVYFEDDACGGPVSVGGRGYGYPGCKFTYIDKTGRVITQERFDKGRAFSEGLAPVRIGDRWGFMDKAATVVVAPRFEDAEPFSSGLSRIRAHDLHGYTDKSGTLQIAPRYKYAEDFSEGFAVVGDVRGRVWYINRRGRKAFPGEFALGSPFFKGLAHVKLLPGDAAKERAEFAYIDTAGRRVFTY